MRQLVTRVLAWSRAIWQRPSIRRTVAEEIDFHVRMETDARRGRGLSPGDARRSTLAAFGNPSLVRAEILDVRTPSLARFIDGVAQDVRYAARTFARAPLAVASVVLVLAVAIGVTSTVFAAIDAVFFKPLAVPHPDRIAYVSTTSGRVDNDAFIERAQGAIILSAPTTPTQSTLSNENLHVRSRGEEVGVDYFSTLEVQPALGRFFNAGDADPGEGPVAVVVSYDLWKSRLGFDSEIIGQQIQMENARGTIVGVAPAGFRGVALPWQPSQFWAIRWWPPSLPRAKRTVSTALVAHLAPGVTARTLSAMVTRHDPSVAPDTDLTAFSVAPAVGLLAPESQLSSFGFVRALADTVAVMAVIVMLIAAANVVGILLARGVTRSSELAVRRALGAGARRLTQQLMTESLVLGLGAGAAGVFVAWVLISLYRALAPADIALDVDINVRVLAVTLIACCTAGLTVGIVPVRQALKIDVLSALGAPGATMPVRTKRRLRFGAVVPQMALSIALLIVAGAHARALWTVEAGNPGYRLSDVITMRVSPRMQYFKKGEDALAAATNVEFRATVLDAIRHTASVAGAAFAAGDLGTSVDFPKRPVTTRAANGGDVTVASASGTYVSGDFFSTVGIPLIAGRPFNDERDAFGSPPVAIVSRAFAEAIAAQGQALGRLIETRKVGRPDQTESREIVGIVDDVRRGAEIVPMVYWPTTQFPSFVPLALTVRVTGEPLSVAPRLARVVAAIDPRAKVEEPLTQAETLARAHFARRLTLALVGVAGLFGVALAAIGLYSAVSYSVAQQRKSLAVRATLGASGGQLLTLVVGEGARTVLIAILPGICLGLIGFRVTGGLLAFVAGPVAAPGIAVVVTVCLAVAALSVLACLVPGLRAARTSPVVLLR